MLEKFIEIFNKSNPELQHNCVHCYVAHAASLSTSKLKCELTKDQTDKPVVATYLHLCSCFREGKKKTLNLCKECFQDVF